MSVRKQSAGELMYNFKPLQWDESNENENKTNGKSKSDGLFLYFAAFTASLSFFGCGSCIVWPSPVIIQLQSNDTNVNPIGYPVSSNDISLIVGTFAIGNLITPLFMGKLMDAIGRKKTLIAIGVCNIIFLVVLAFASNLMWILIPRLATGLCTGGAMISLPIYLSEITADHNRGKFGVFMGLFMPLGQLYGYIMGSFFSIKTFTLLCAVPVVIHTVLFLLFFPETPVHLLHKGETDLALSALKKYRSNESSKEIHKDIEIMLYKIEHTTENNSGSWYSLFRHRATRRGLVVGFGMVIIQFGTGVAVLMSFMGPIFEEANTGLSGNMISILVGSVKIVTFFLVAHIVDKLGRKPLMLISTTLCSIPLFLIGVYFFLKENNYSWYSDYAWLPLVSIFFFVIAYSIGLGPIPLATIGELFTTNVRSTAFSTVAFFATLFNTVLIASFPIVLKFIGISGCMWFFSGSCIFGIVFVYFVMPETKGKSIYEIQELLNEKKNCINTIPEEEDC